MSTIPVRRDRSRSPGMAASGRIRTAGTPEDRLKAARRGLHRMILAGAEMQTLAGSLAELASQVDRCASEEVVQPKDPHHRLSEPLETLGAHLALLSGQLAPTLDELGTRGQQVSTLAAGAALASMRVQIYLQLLEERSPDLLSSAVRGACLEKLLLCEERLAKGLETLQRSRQDTHRLRLLARTARDLALNIRIESTRCELGQLPLILLSEQVGGLLDRMELRLELIDETINSGIDGLRFFLGEVDG